MKTVLIIVIVLFASFASVAQTFYWIGSGTDWTSTSSWSASSGGVSCNCVPGATQQVVFDNASGNCVVSSAVSVAGLTLTGTFSGTISLTNSASNLTSTGTSIFAGGTITDNGAGAALLLSTGTASATFSGTIFNTAISGSSGDLFFNGSQFKKNVMLTKTVSNTNSSLGGNTFEASTTIQLAAGTIRLATGSAGDTFTGTGQLAIILQGASSQFFPSSEKNTSIFDGPISITYGTNTGIVDFGNSQVSTGSPMISTMSVGITSMTCASGCGSLRMSRLTHASSQTINLLTTPTSTLTLGPNVTFNGAIIDFTAPSVILNGSTFSAATMTSLNQTGSSTSSATYGAGGNTFNGATTMTNSGAGYWVMNGTGALSPDIFNGTLTLNNTSTGSIFMADGASGNMFNGNIILNNSSTGGIFFSDNVRGNATNTGRATHTSGVVTIGSFSSGTLRFKYFTENQSLNLTQASGSAILYLGTGCVIQNATISFPNIKLDGATYNGTASFTKNSSATVNDDCAGGNVFNGATTLTNQSNFHLALAYGSSGTGGPGDTFNSTLTINNSAAGKIQLAHLGTSATALNGDVTFRSSNSSGIITIGTAGGAGAVISTSARLLATTTDFTAGSLYLSNISQAASAVTHNLKLQGGLHVGTFRSVTLNGNVIIEAKPLNIGASSTVNAKLLGNNDITGHSTTNIAYSTFGSSALNTTVITKSSLSSASETWTGGNTFNSVTTMNNQSSFDVTTTFNGPGDTFNSTLTLNNSASGKIQFAYSGSSSTNLNADVTFRCSNSSGSITVGGGTGSSVSVGSGARLVATADFTAGSLYLSNISQGASSVTHSLQILGNLYIGTIRNVSIGGNMTISAALINIGTSSTVNARLLGDNNITANGSLNLSYSTFGTSSSNTTQIIKSASSTSDDLCTGGNTFNATTTFQTVLSSGVLTLANTTGDTFNADVAFNSYNASSIRPAFTGNNYFFGNISVNSSLNIGTTSSWLFMSGSADQTISTSNSNPVFRRLKMDKTGAGAVYIANNSFVRIGNVLDFTSGVINTSSSGSLVFLTGSVYTNASDNSHVNGPVRKIGTEEFTFPVGTATLYRPVTISAPSTSSEFIAEYFNASARATYGNAGLPAGRSVSDCQYWTLQRTAGTALVDVILHWFSLACTPLTNDDITDLTISRWTGSQWIEIAQTYSSGNNSSGSVGVSSQDIPTATPFSVTSPVMILPVRLISFEAHLRSDNTVALKWKTGEEKNNLGFEILKSNDGRTFEKVAFVPGRLNAEIVTAYEFDDRFVQSKNYYRLNQIDIDGNSALSEIVFVALGNYENTAEVWPNPFTNGFQLKLVGVELGEEVFITVLDRNGTVISKLFGPINSINQPISDKFSFLPAGVYFIQISSGTFRVTEKVTKL
jgi:hypothetical protein